MLSFSRFPVLSIFSTKYMFGGRVHHTGITTRWEMGFLFTSTQIGKHLPHHFGIWTGCRMFGWQSRWQNRNPLKEKQQKTEVNLPMEFVKHAHTHKHPQFLPMQTLSLQGSTLSAIAFQFLIVYDKQGSHHNRTLLTQPHAQPSPFRADFQMLAINPMCKARLLNVCLC